MVRSLILAGGCFWCVEHDIAELDGVISVTSGYSGGDMDKPTYENHAGHREVVLVYYDDEEISLRKLLQTFLDTIDPTDTGGQFGDRGESYKTAIYYATDEEKVTAELLIRELNESHVYDKPAQVEILPRKEFYPAEEVHQGYAEKNPLRYQLYREGSGRQAFVERTCKIREEKHIPWKENVSEKETLRTEKEALSARVVPQAFLKHETRDYSEEALTLHKEHRGKIEIGIKVPLANRDDLSRAYTPGVAEVCREIAKDKSSVYDYTLKGNTVAIVTDGSAILGLGNLGPGAALPVMEGKAAILKAFAGVDAFPICLDTQDTEEIIKAVKQIAPVFGAINLEDIAAPRCFEIEERLRHELSIPVMHDDQWGAATVSLTAFINALALRGLKKEEARVVISGIGAAGVATARLLFAYGVYNIVFCDSKGIIFRGREDLTKEKKELLAKSTAKVQTGALMDAVKGAHVFIGLSKPGVLTKAMVETMAERPIIFALANPTPEIMPEEAFAAGAFIMATGRSDYPNQINNSLVFPGAFRGILEARIPQFKMEMFVAIAEGLAQFVHDATPEKILPTMFDEGVVELVSSIVKQFK